MDNPNRRLTKSFHPSSNAGWPLPDNEAGGGAGPSASFMSTFAKRYPSGPTQTLIHIIQTLAEDDEAEAERDSDETETDSEGEREGDGPEEVVEEYSSNRVASSDESEDDEPPQFEESESSVMFGSTTSDFVTFRPDKPLRFTCLTIGSRGDVQPYIALCKGLMAQGHSCKIASHGEYREWVEGHGIAFEAVGGDPAALMQLMIAHDFFSISFMKEAVGRFRGWLDDLLETAWDACQDCDVLIESPSAIAGLHIAEGMQIPYYRAFTMPWSRTRAYPHAFAVPDHKMGGRYNYMTYTMFDHIFWRATASQVNRWRKRQLGLGSTSLERMKQHAVPFLYNFSPVIVPHAHDWPENIHVTGYWWLDNPDDSHQLKWEAPQDVLDFLARAKDKQKKVVFIGFGSIIIPDPEEMTRIVLEAVEEADVYAIVAKGWSDRAVSKDDSAQEKREAAEQEEKEAEMLDQDFILNIKAIPHDWLFPRIDAAVHHGGAGTTGASVRAGLPTIIKPFFGDQHFYADRVSRLGIGSHIKSMTAKHLAQAIVTAVTDEKQISRAKAAGEAIRRENGVGNAIECIYRDLDYARSLIRPKPNKDDPQGLAHTDSTLAHASKKISAPIRSLIGKKEPPAESTTPPRATHSAPTSPPNGSSDEGWDVLSNRSSTRDSSMRGSSNSRQVLGSDGDESADEGGGGGRELLQQPDERLAGEGAKHGESRDEDRSSSAGGAGGLTSKMWKVIPKSLPGLGLGHAFPAKREPTPEEKR